MKISRRRVQQIGKHFQETGSEPVLGRNIGRPRKPFVKREAEIIREAYGRYRFGARMLEKVIRKQYKVRISHNRIHEYLKVEGLACEDKGRRSGANGTDTNVSIAFRQEYVFSCPRIDRWILFSVLSALVGSHGKSLPSFPKGNKYRNCEGTMSGKREIACGVDVHNKFVMATILPRLTSFLLFSALALHQVFSFDYFHNIVFKRLYDLPKGIINCLLVF